MSATEEPVQPYNLISSLPSTPASHPFVSTRDTGSARATGQIFYLIWQETLKAAKSA